jgi:hypothetical protein
MLGTLLEWQPSSLVAPLPHPRAFLPRQVKGRARAPEPKVEVAAGAEGGSVACRELWREVSFRVCKRVEGDRGSRVLKKRILYSNALTKNRLTIQTWERS